jgi:hypothetical protein
VAVVFTKSYGVPDRRKINAHKRRNAYAIASNPKSPSAIIECSRRKENLIGTIKIRKHPYFDLVLTATPEKTLPFKDEPPRFGHVQRRYYVV